MIDIPFGLWKIGDIVTRDGSDEHEIVYICEGGDLMRFRCIKEPKIYGDESEPWAKIGEDEDNCPWRYGFIRGGK